MTPAIPRDRRTLLWVLLAAASAAMIAVIAPFFGTVLWSVILALLFKPLDRWLVRRLGGRRTPAALLTLVVVLVVVVLPFSIVGAAVVAEAAVWVDRLQSSNADPDLMLRRAFAALPPWADGLLQRIGLDDAADLERRLTTMLGQGGQFIVGRVLRLGQDTFELVASWLIMLYVAFFLLRDGDRIVAALRTSVPMARADQRELAEKFTTVIRATVKGNVLVAIVQGALGGIAFWALDIGAALVWTVLMALLSLLPTIGSAIVWLPVAIVLIATGDVAQGVALIVWGAGVVGLVDNVLRPKLVGKDTRLPDYVVLVTTLGGIVVFGINGFVIGPVIAAMFFAVWHITLARRGDDAHAGADASTG